jgi:hypothetical protein
MAISRLTTWSSGQTLTASALNAEINNIINNGVDLWSPASKSTSYGGFSLVLDAAGVTSVQSPGTSGFLLTPGAKIGTPSTTGGTWNLAAHTYTDSATSASGTATQWVGTAIQRPTLAASNTSVTTTDAATLYVANAPAAGSNQTLTSAWAFWVDDGAVRLDLTTSKPSSASAVCRALYLPAATQTISGSTNITTATGYNYIEVAQPTLSAATALTITNAATLYIADAPAAGGAGPAAISNAYALWVDAGAVRFDGAATIAGALTQTGAIDANSTMTLSGTLTMDGTNNAIIPAAAPATPVAHGLYRDNIAKGWAQVSVSGGTPTLNADYNVTSITDSGVGELTITWETDFTSANYALSVCGAGPAGSDHAVFNIDGDNLPGTGSCRATCATGGNVLQDPQIWTVLAFGVQ